jgi:FKBP-type peptidyl-prolyl cis-trans isomerase
MRNPIPLIILAVSGVVLIGTIATFIIMNQNTNTTPQSKTFTKTITTSSNSSTIESKLIIEDLRIGDGAELKPKDTATFHYTGTLEDGKKFDSSKDRGEPFTTQIGIGQVIKGWDEGIPGMKVGGVRKITIPSELGYGDRGVPGVIPGKATLVFEVELLSIK